MGSAIKIAIALVTMFSSVAIDAQAPVEDPCPVTGVTFREVEETDFPGSSEARFSRMQGLLPDCMYHAGVDFLAYWAKKTGVWKDGAIYQSGGSAQDLKMQLAKKKGLKFSNVQEYLYYGDASVKRDVEAMFSIANEIGICPEGAFASQVNSSATGMIEAHRAFQSAYDRMVSEGSRVADLLSCPECKRLAPGIQSSRQAQSTTFPRSPYSALEFLNENACAPNVRVKIPKLSLDISVGFRSVYKQLRVGNPVLVSVRPDAFLGDSQFKKEVERHRATSSGAMPNHAVIAVAAIRIKEFGNQCYIAVKSSWAEKCIEDLPGRVCLHSDAIALRRDIFENSASWNAWVRLD
jgi:hypothetical protein